ncbi:MAG: glycosyltransferase family protein [Candidatus Omnitrophica bacterium]|nr:glycosyltransferase family protein [Candidatus Omnitrophota bacterium]
MDKTIAIIQARTGSRRLPGKVLRLMAGKPVLEHIIDRVKGARRIQEVMVATTILKEDLNIVSLCAAKGVRVYCGSENDVLDRYYQAARLVQADNIVRITGDCPLIDPVIINKVINHHLRSRADYSANVLKHTFPDGEDVEVFSFNALEKAWKEARLLSEREHVTPYIWKNPRRFTLSGIEHQDDLSAKRWTLDNPQDLKFIDMIYRHLYGKKRSFGMTDVLKLLKSHPEYEMINAKISRNEGYAKSLKNDKVLT